jgi:transcriptional regulator with XRE-family HTH domain
MKHAGELVKAVVADRGISVALLARRLGRSRQFVYNLFEKPSLDLELLHLLRKELNYPFAELMGNDPKVRMYGTSYLSEAEYNNLSEQLEAAIREKELWKDKYTRLLEEMNRLLQQRKP